LISVNSPDWIKIDSVGRPLGGVDVKLGNDNELIVRGDCLMKGYWEDEQATAGTIVDGWLHTGDLASIDEDGFIRITGRKKDLIVTSGGENVSPSKIETLLCSQEEIEQAVVFGDGRPWLGAVIVPNQETSSDANEQINAAIKRVNDELNSSEKIRKYTIQSEPCTTENGLLTPTQKIKRFRVLELNKHEIEVLY
jgi:long-chain acyl-CoA synthetase